MRKGIVLAMAILMSSIVFGQTAPFEVVVVDFKENPLEGEQIVFVGKTSGKTLKGVTDATGKFEMDLPAGETYDIKIKSVGDAQDYNTMEIPTLGEGQSFNKGLLTIMIEQPKIFTLDNVHFATGKSTLTSTSYKELNELVSFLKLKKDKKVEIAGHTDNVGDDAANQKLSQDRADAVKKYLLSKGVAADRVTAKGYGETSPVADNGTSDGRKKNRRTEARLQN